MDIKRIGIITSGGDCGGLNAVNGHPHGSNAKWVEKIAETLGMFSNLLIKTGQKQITYDEKVLKLILRKLHDIEGLLLEIQAERRN